MSRASGWSDTATRCLPSKSSIGPRMRMSIMASSPWANVPRRQRTSQGTAIRSGVPVHSASQARWVANREPVEVAGRELRAADPARPAAVVRAAGPEQPPVDLHQHGVVGGVDGYPPARAGGAVSLEVPRHPRLDAEHTGHGARVVEPDDRRAIGLAALVPAAQQIR